MAKPLTAQSSLTGLARTIPMEDRSLLSGTLVTVGQLLGPSCPTRISQSVPSRSTLPLPMRISNRRPCTSTAEIAYCGECTPVCDAGGPYQGVTGSVIQFDGSGSSTWSTCFPIVLYTWSFGDGLTASGPRPTHVYATAGAYAVTLQVFDSNFVGSACTTDVVVTTAQPVESTSLGQSQSHRKEPGIEVPKSAAPVA